MDIEAFLRKFQIFSDLTSDEFLAVAAAFFPRRYARGETVLAQGEISPQLILIEEGEISIYQGIGKKRQAVAKRGPGESLGEFTVLGNEQHSATAIATSDVSAYVSLGADFQGLVAQNAPGIAKILARLLNVSVGRHRQMAEKLDLSSAADLTTLSVEDRLMTAIQTRERVLASFASGVEGSTEGFFRLVDFSTELGVPVVRLVADLDAKALPGKELKVREYIVPTSCLRFLCFETIVRG